MRDDAQLGITQSERHNYENPELLSSLPTVFEGKMSVREPKLSSREQLSNTGEYVEYTKVCQLCNVSQAKTVSKAGVRNVYAFHV